MTRGDVLAILRNVATVDRDLSFQVFFILHTGCSLRYSCRLRWDDITDDEAAEIVRYAPLDYSPYVYKYRSPSQVSQRLRTVVKTLGIQPMVTLEELREGYR